MSPISILENPFSWSRRKTNWDQGALFICEHQKGPLKACTAWICEYLQSHILRLKQYCSQMARLHFNISQTAYPFESRFERDRQQEGEFCLDFSRQWHYLRLSACCEWRMHYKCYLPTHSHSKRRNSRNCLHRCDVVAVIASNVQAINKEHDIWLVNYNSSPHRQRCRIVSISPNLPLLTSSSNKANKGSLGLTPAG